MRHGKKFNHLGRKSAHRQETLSSMAASLILHKRINTTLAKAKALRVYVEPLITKSKVDSTHSRRTVFSYLGSKQAVSELFRDVSQKVADRPGGYTRILKTGFRKGDSAEMCFIELVDYNANMLRSDDESRQKTTRRAGKRKKAVADAPVESAKGKVAETKVKSAPKVVAEEPEAKVVAQDVAADVQEEVVDQVATSEEESTKPEGQPEGDAAEEDKK